MSSTAAPIASLRREYGDSPLDPASLPDEPIAAFAAFFESARAAEVAEPNAMTLVTVASDGPSGRIVLLKAVDARGFTFFTNYESDKAKDLAADPRCALVFAWVEIHRQVRVRGVAEKVLREESEAYFATRPRASQLGAWASAQSAPIASREILEEHMRAVTERFEGKDIPAPPHWGGYRVVPSEVELWQGRRSRLHDRVRYTRTSDGWKKERLSP